MILDISGRLKIVVLSHVLLFKQRWFVDRSIKLVKLIDQTQNILKHQVGIRFLLGFCCLVFLLLYTFYNGKVPGYPLKRLFFGVTASWQSSSSSSSSSSSWGYQNPGSQWEAIIFLMFFLKLFETPLVFTTLLTPKASFIITKASRLFPCSVAQRNSWKKNWDHKKTTRKLDTKVNFTLAVWRRPCWSPLEGNIYLNWYLLYKSI